jgi:hypothetical protein
VRDSACRGWYGGSVAVDREPVTGPWEYAEVRLYRRVTQILFSHEQSPDLVERWTQRSPESVDQRRSNASYVQLNRQEEPLGVLAVLGDDGWELVDALSVQISLRYVLKRARR